MLTVIIFILILALLVLVHEFGHFIVARKSGIKVYEFGFGFPPRAIGFYKDPTTRKFVFVWGNKNHKSTNLLNTAGGAETNEDGQFPATLYSLNWLPLGGFCKMKGENGEQANEPDSFGWQKAWKRALTLVAGVTMNFILAGILLGIGLMIGMPSDFGAGVDKNAIVMQAPQVMVQMVEKDSPAQKAGIKYGDKIISVNNILIKNSEEMTKYVSAHSGEVLTVLVDRVGEQETFTMTPTIIKADETSPRLGILMADAGIVRYPWYLAIYKGFVGAFWSLLNIFVAFYLLIKNLIIGQGLAFNVAGPVGIAVMVGDSARLGFSYLLNITAMISLSLAAINILPIPALDGGRILFIVLEKIFRRPLPMKYEQLAHTIGFMLLMILIVLVTGRDIWGLIR